jgi:hypothetical protein
MSLFLELPSWCATKLPSRHSAPYEVRHTPGVKRFTCDVSPDRSAIAGQIKAGLYQVLDSAG